MRRTLGVLLSAVLIPLSLLSEAQALPAFGAPKTMPQSDSTNEPGIDIGITTPAAPGGTIFVNAPSGVPTHSRLWRSTDGGASYKRVPFPSPYQQLPGGGDSDVALSPTGRVYFLDLSVASNSLARSDNNGESWSFGTPFTTLPLSDRQWMALGGPGDTPNDDTVYIVYALIQPPSSVMIAKSTNSGLTWTTHQVAPSFGAATGFTGQIVADASGYVGFIYHQTGRMNYAFSTDGAKTFTTRILGEEAQQTMPSVALDGDTLHATWIRRTDFAVMESHSTDKGDTWSPERVVSSAGTTNMFSWVDSRGDKSAIAWYSADTTGAPDQVNAAWYVRYSESLDEGVTYTTPVNAAAAPAKMGAICISGLACGGDRELGDFLQVAVDKQGKSLVAYNVVPEPGSYTVAVVKQV